MKGHRRRNSQDECGPIYHLLSLLQLLCVSGKPVVPILVQWQKLSASCRKTSLGLSSVTELVKAAYKTGRYVTTVALIKRKIVAV